MTGYTARLFPSDEAIERVGEGLVSRTLPRPEWTHEAHLAASAYLLLRRPDIDVDAELPDIIRGYNESVGGVNSDSEGYHETITRVFLHGVRLFIAEADQARPLHDLVNELLLSPMGRRDWPLRFYSPELLFSVEARHQFVQPDLSELPPNAGARRRHRRAEAAGGRRVPQCSVPNGAPGGRGGSSA